MTNPNVETVASADACVRFAQFGAPDVLEVEHLPGAPEPGPGEVRVRIEASSVQFTDTLIRRGIYPDLKDKPPITPGYDLVGRVDAVGEGVEGWAVGQRVADLCVIGGNARFAIRPANRLVPVPDDVDPAEAATLVLSWLTAQQALFRTGRLATGERVLVVGGNGAVGQAAIALAVRAGCEVYATAREAHHDAIRAAGATPLPREGWLPEVRGTIDVVLDGIGADAFRSPIRSLRRGGRLVALGSSAMAQGNWHVLPFSIWRLVTQYLLPNGRQVAFYSIAGRRKRLPEEYSDDLQALFALLAAGEIRPIVAERLRLDEVAEAHARLEAGGLAGKLVLEPWRDTP